MAAWPSNPDWTDLSNINKGNEYVGGDGIYYSDLNAIVKNLLVIKKQLDMLSYSIDITATHCVPDPQNPTKIIFAGTSTLRFTAETGYTLPSTVSIAGATSTWTVSNGVGTLTLKDPTSNITGSIVATIITYSISYSATHITPSSSNPSTIAYGGSASLTFTVPTGYVSPQNGSNITVSGATLSAYSRVSDTKCTLTISNPTGNVLVTIAGVARTYTITANIYDGTADSSNPHTITYGQSATLIYIANPGYKLPDTISVTGASYTWEPNTGVLDLSNPNTNVIIQISCVQDTTTVTYNLTHCTAASTNPATVRIGGSADLKFIADAGYELSATPTVTGATLASWDYPVADDKTTMVAGIENVTGPVTITVVGSLPQLATPQNVAADGTTVSWDEVENATSYAVLADGNEIGTVEKEKKFYADENTAQTFRDWADYLYSTVFNSGTVGVHLFKGYEAVPHYLLMTSEYCTIDDDTTKRTQSMTTSERDLVKAEIEKIIALAGDAHDLDSIRDLNCSTKLKKYSENMFAFMGLTLKINSIVGQTTYTIVDVKENILAKIIAPITL